jgi:glycine cleavage system pyridoxal-binding protein P
MVTDLTGMEIANASLLDEATAAAEAMVFCQRLSKSKSTTFFVSQDCYRGEQGKRKKSYAKDFSDAPAILLACYGPVVASPWTDEH